MNEKIIWHTERRKLGDLIEWDKNPRQLTTHDAEHLKKSLNNFGIADPLIINTDNRIIGGHMRRRIILQNGYKPNDLVDVRVPDRTLTEREAEELAIRLNKNSGSWDFDALANTFEFDDLIEWGFSDEELKGLDFGDPEPPDDPGAQIDKAEELREKWSVELGQLWQLGEHRLICGDCTDKAVVDRVMGGERAELLLTDPPYGVDAVGANGNIGGDTSNAKAGIYHSIIGDDKPFSSEHLFNLADSAIIWGANYFCLSLPKEGQWLVWDKNRPVGTTFSDCELAWTDGTGKAIKKYKCTWDGFHREGESGKRQHPTQKPVKLFEDILKDYKAEIILDTYLGSGTTLIACERLNRKCRAIEIMPNYVAVAIQRWVDMTGGIPELITED